MQGKLSFVYMPVENLKSALRFYRDELGLEEAWREGETTAAFKLPGTEVALMIDQDRLGGPGPVFLIQSVDTFCAEQQGKIEFTGAPIDIPGGRLVSAKDASGNTLYFMDMSKRG